MDLRNPIPRLGRTGLREAIADLRERGLIVTATAPRVRRQDGREDRATQIHRLMHGTPAVQHRDLIQ